jgi:hypothetical protein
MSGLASVAEEEERYLTYLALPWLEAQELQASSLFGSTHSENIRTSLQGRRC